MSCRICGGPTREVLDLGESPPANRLKASPDEEETSYPLVVEWCDACGNVQLRDTLPAHILYRDYFYVTPQSSMLQSHYEYLESYLHANGYLNQDAFVVEPGSNAGHFLAHLRPNVARVLGVDPAERIARMANDGGVRTICDFFTPLLARKIAETDGPADLVVARHCLAHNQSPHDMVAAASTLLRDGGHLVIENAYVLNTIENTEFDQIYHEHMFYFSIRSMKRLLELHGMRVVDVLMSLVHGGSIIFIAQNGLAGPVRPSVAAYEAREAHALTAEAFEDFGRRTRRVKARLIELVDEVRADGHSVYRLRRHSQGQHAVELRWPQQGSGSVLRRQHTHEAGPISPALQRQDHLGGGRPRGSSRLLLAHGVELRGRNRPQGALVRKLSIPVHRPDPLRSDRVR